MLYNNYMLSSPTNYDYFVFFFGFFLIYTIISRVNHNLQCAKFFQADGRRFVTHFIFDLIWIIIYIIVHVIGVRCDPAIGPIYCTAATGETSISEFRSRILCRTKCHTRINIMLLYLYLIPVCVCVCVCVYVYTITC